MKQNPQNKAACLMRIKLFPKMAKLSKEWSTEYKLFMSLQILLLLSTHLKY